jgi:hypothetical protein
MSVRGSTQRNGWTYLWMLTVHALRLPTSSSYGTRCIFCVDCTKVGHHILYICVAAVRAVGRVSLRATALPTTSTGCAPAQPSVCCGCQPSPFLVGPPSQVGAGVQLLSRSIHLHRAGLRHLVSCYHCTQSTTDVRLIRFLIIIIIKVTQSSHSINAISPTTDVKLTRLSSATVVTIAAQAY